MLYHHHKYFKKILIKRMSKQIFSKVLQKINRFYKRQQTNKKYLMVFKRRDFKNKTTQQKEKEDFAISSTKKNILLGQTEINEDQLDQTQKFLKQTIQRLNLSKKQLHQFYLKIKIFNTKKLNIDFSILGEQIKFTKLKLKNKFSLGLKKNLSSLNNLPPPSQYDIEIKDKLNLLSKVLTEEEIDEFTTQLINREKNIQSQYQGNPDLQYKLIKYCKNYQIISRFLQQVAKNTQKLTFKQKNQQIYYKMKDEMISLISNQKIFQTHLKQIDERQKIRKQSLLAQNNYQYERFRKTSQKTKSSCSAQNSLMEKIQGLLETSKNSIKQAFSQFNKPFITSKIQQEFNKRCTLTRFNSQFLSKSQQNS